MTITGFLAIIGWIFLILSWILAAVEYNTQGDTTLLTTTRMALNILALACFMVNLVIIPILG